MKHRRAGWFVIAALHAGCSSFGSISPLLEHDAAQYDPRLLGTWLDSARSMSILVTGEDSAYRMLITTYNRGENRHYSAEVGQLDGLRLLELLPLDPELRYGDAFSDLDLSLYYPVIVDSVGAAASIRFIDTDSLQDYLRRKSGAIAHAIRSHDSYSQVLITAPTDKWRRFFRNYVQRAGATAPMRFERFPTPVLHATAELRGRLYRLNAQGQCLHVHVRSSRLALVPGQVWRVSAEAKGPGVDDLGWVDLQVFEPDSSLVASFILQLGGPEVITTEVSAQQLSPVERRDSTAVLTVAGQDPGGMTVRVSIECSTVTELASM